MIRRTHQGAASDSVSSSGHKRPSFTAHAVGIAGSAAYATRPSHDYAYGASRASLRPVVPVSRNG